MKRTLPLLTLLLIGALTGCNNDSNDPTPEPKVQQMGYGEVELYDVARHPDGHIIQPGETAVLALEAINGAAAPTPEGDTSNAGIDEITFDVKDAGPLTLALAEVDLAVIAKAELWNQTGGLLAQVDRQTLSRTVSLTAGRYLLRVYSGHTQATPVSVFVYPTVATLSQTNAQLRFDPAQVQQLLQTNSCPGCDLSGADLSDALLPEANLNGAKLPEANLTESDLTKATLIGADLTGATLFQLILHKAILHRANLTGADLKEAILTEADLSKANLTEADLSGADLSVMYGETGANLTGANLTGANLTGADLSRAIWIDGRVCADGSIGQCN